MVFVTSAPVKRVRLHVARAPETAYAAEILTATRRLPAPWPASPIGLGRAMSGFRFPVEKCIRGSGQEQRHRHQDKGEGAPQGPIGLPRDLVVDDGRHHLKARDRKSVV